MIAAVRQAPRHPDLHPPLYVLRVSSSLHEELKQALRASLRTSNQLTSLACAGFCLYAAGEFCRSHDGGPWKWATVLTPIGLICGPQELYEIVERGLEYWHRDIISTSSGRRFLTTLACEGGLPLSLLRHEHASLTRYFRRLLLESEQFPNESVLEIAEREEITLLLPATLRQEQVYRLAAELITPVRAVRRQIPDDARDPLIAADERIPGWRERLPITVSEKVVDELLRGLLRERRVSQVSTEVISVQCSLDVKTGTVHRVLAVPPEASAEELAQLLRVRTNELPMRFRIYAQRAGGERQPIAVATRFQERYQLERFSIADFNSAERVTVVALAGPRRVSDEAPVPGGDPLPTDAPWIFTDDEGPTQRMLGAGSLSTRRQSVLIAAPKDATVAAVSGDDIVVVGQSAESRSIVRLRGDVDISGPDDTWRVRLATQAEELPEFRIRGATLRLGASGSSVFIGCPQVWSSDEGRSLHASELEWKSAATPGASWRSATDTPIGDIVLRHRHASGTRFRARITVMPPSFGLSFERGDRPGEGVLFLRQVGPCQVSVVGDACSCDYEQSGNDLRVTFATNTRAPRTLPVELRFRDRCTARVEVSYPEERHDFVRWSGEPIEWNSRITLHELNHLRAVVQTPRPRRLYVLRGELWRTSEGQRSRGDVPYELRELHLGELQRIADGELELPLDAIRGELEAALSVMDDLNAEIRLKIRAEGETDPGGRYVAVSRCPSRLTTETCEDGFTIGVHPPHRNVGIKLVAMSMRDNLRVREELPQTATGWLFSTAEREPGTWLIACSERRTDAPRPVFITVHRGTVRPDDHTLRELLGLIRSRRQVAYAAI